MAGLKAVFENESNEYLVPIIWYAGLAQDLYTARCNFYSVEGVPDSYWGGILQHLGGANCEAQYQSKYDQLVTTDAPVEIDLDFGFDDSGDLLVTADVTLTSDLTTTNNKIWISLTEEYSDQYFQAALNFNEQDFTQTTSGDTGTYTLSLPVDASWNLPSLHAVVVVQDFSSPFTVYQCARQGLAPNASIAGAVIDGFTSAPIANAVITAGPYSTTTDGDGEFAIDMIQGTYDITCEMDGYYTGLEEDVEVEPDVVTDVNFTMNEATIAPVALNYQMIGTDCILSWQAPGYMPVAEDFESGVLPIGWNALSDGAGWAVTANGGSSYWAVPSHTTYAVANDDGAGETNDGDSDYLIMPMLDLTSYATLDLKFASFFTGAYDQTAHVVISYDMSTWTVLEDMVAGPAWQEDVTVSLADYCGPGNETIFIGFWANDHGEWASGWAVDDIMLCTAPTRDFIGYNVYAVGNDTPLNGDTPIADLTYTASTAGGDNAFYVTAVYTSGESEPSNTITVNSINDNNVFGMPVKTALNANYPNPFNPETVISYSLSSAGNVSVELYNVKGQLVKTLVNGFTEAGNHKMVWNGTNDSGNDVPSGVYFCKMVTPDYTGTQKMLLLK